MPPRNQKIDTQRMMSMLRDGESIRSIAKHFNCTVNAVWTMKKREEARLAAIPDVAKSELSCDNINTVQQLRVMNDTILDELKRCRRLIDRQDSIELEKEKLEDQIKKDPKNTDLVTKLKAMGYSRLSDILKIQSQLFAISAEVRKQIELQVKIYETIYNVRLVAEFQEEILEVLRTVEPSIREQAIRKLKERRSIRGLMRMDK